MLKYGDLVITYDQGEIKTDGKFDTDTGRVDAVFIETNGLLGDIEIAQFECLNGEIFPVCKECHGYILVSEDECSNEICPSNHAPDADQINLFEKNSDIVA